MSGAAVDSGGGARHLDVDVRGLVVDFPARGIRAVDEVDLAVAAGEQVALLGPSGSGKTTLLRALLGAVPAAAGRIRLGDLDPFGPAREVRRLRQATGIVRQGNDLVLGTTGRLNAVSGTSPSWGVRDWVAVGRGQAPARWRERLLELAAAHGVDGCLDARVAELSGGQRQRVALVRALLPGPGLLLADEPTNGLDPRTGAAAVDALRSTGVTLVVATHDLDVARRFPRVVALREGAKVHDGPGLDPAAAALVYGSGEP